MMKNRRRNFNSSQASSPGELPHRAQLLWTSLVALTVGITAIYRVNSPKSILLQEPLIIQGYDSRLSVAPLNLKAETRSSFEVDLAETFSANERQLETPYNSQQRQPSSD